MIVVYAIASADAGRMTIRGLAGERLRPTRVGHIVAIVGEHRAAPEPTEANLRKYDRVIHVISQRASALLPARFGTAVHDLNELTWILGARQTALRARLKEVRKRVQMTVRMVTKTGSGIPDPGFAGSAGSAGSGGAEYLRARARAAAIPEFAPLRDAVTKWIRGERVEKRGTVVTIYHLVPRSSAHTYRRVLETTAGAAGVRVIVSGPWPAYAFADPLAA